MTLSLSRCEEARLFADEAISVFEGVDDLPLGLSTLKDKDNKKGKTTKAIATAVEDTASQ